MENFKVKEFQTSYLLKTEFKDSLEDKLYLYTSFGFSNKDTENLEGLNSFLTLIVKNYNSLSTLIKNLSVKQSELPPKLFQKFFLDKIKKYTSLKSLQDLETITSINLVQKISFEEGATLLFPLELKNSIDENKLIKETIHFLVSQK